MLASAGLRARAEVEKAARVACDTTVENMMCFLFILFKKIIMSN